MRLTKCINRAARPECETGEWATPVVASLEHPAFNSIVLMIDRSDFRGVGLSALRGTLHTPEIRLCLVLQIQIDHQWKGSAKLCYGLCGV